jgi:mannose-6-phosphate isomerase-like protein (cupin superfamily)
MMASVDRVDLTKFVLDIRPDLSITLRETKPGPPERIEGMTVGFVTIAPGESPHSGEMHPDGDEVLFVVSGTLRVTHDSGNEPMDLTAGQACVVRKGEWHMVDCLEETRLIHITPGPNGEARFN